MVECDTNILSARPQSFELTERHHPKNDESGGVENVKMYLPHSADPVERSKRAFWCQKFRI
jgi:hypothetical protein